MRYLSVCSGIEAATVAWHPLGWTPVAFSEIEPFPSAVLAHHYPQVPNLGDMTNHATWPLQPGDIDLLVGGTPCQSFSVAGLRKGLSDPRGGLMLTYLEIARRLRPRWVVWENVPGVLSSNGGRDFGSFLGALGELGYGWAYRVLDAQWVRTQRHPRAVPQRRRRVFVVGCLGDARAAAAVLFERESVQRDSAPRRAKGQGAAADASDGAGAGQWPADICSTLNASFGEKMGLEDQHALHGAPMFVPQGTWWDGSDCAATLTKQNANGAQRMPDKDNLGAVLQPIVIDRAAFNQVENAQYDPVIREDDAMPSMVARGPHAVAYPIDTQNMTEGHSSGGLGFGQDGDPSFTVTKGHSHAVAIGTDMYNHAITGDVAATMTKASGGPAASGSTVMQAHGFYSTGGTHGVNQHPEVSPAVKVGSGLGIPSPPAVAFSCKDHGADAGTVAPTMRAMPHDGSHANGGGQIAVAHALRGEGFDASEGGTGRGTPIIPVAPSLTASNDPSRSPQSAEVTQQVAAVHAATMTVRRLTPRECERLQAFPDDYTLIPWRKKPADQCPDGPRYKALGNSMAVNCMEWIGERIAAYEAKETRHDRTRTPPA